MKIEIEDDYADEIIVAGLLQGIKDMDEMLDKLKCPDCTTVPMFEIDREKDRARIRQVRDAMALVVSDWYGEDVEPLEPLERSSTCAVNLIRENADGSADYSFDLTDEQVKAFTRLGIMSAIKAGLDDAKKLDPDCSGDELQEAMNRDRE